MNMIGHYHKAKTCSLGFTQFIGKKVNDNALCAIIIKESAPLNETLDAPRGMAFGIKDLACHCHSRFGVLSKGLLGFAQGQTLPGAPCHHSGIS
jgi:hypothetical protein